ncbi:hypothetical protein QCA50_016122 [Cerrena zonata]|uniref:DUF6532 domain-containing protein n=2 Tax=Cerrena zonata TaxID=2478898 RepID=A0AAW0FKY1_9APHY
MPPKSRTAKKTNVADPEVVGALASQYKAKAKDSAQKRRNGRDPEQGTQGSVGPVADGYGQGVPGRVTRSTVKATTNGGNNVLNEQANRRKRTDSSANEAVEAKRQRTNGTGNPGTNVGGPSVEKTKNSQATTRSTSNTSKVGKNKPAKTMARYPPAPTAHSGDERDFESMQKAKATAAEEESDEDSEGPLPDDSKSQKSDEFESDGSLEELLATAQPGKLALRLQAERPYIPVVDSDVDMVEEVEQRRSSAKQLVTHVQPQRGGKQSSTGLPKQSTAANKHVVEDHIVTSEGDIAMEGSEGDESERLSTRGSSQINDAPTVSAKLRRDPQWPEWTDINWPEKAGQKLQITSQNDPVHRVLDTAIDLLTAVLLFENPWPNILEKDKFSLRTLVDAAKSLEYLEIERRLKLDKDYAKVLAKIPETRFISIRSKLKETAASVIIGMYQLNTSNPEACSARVAQLCNRNENFPLIYRPDPNNNLRHDEDLPFLHPAIIHVFKATPGFWGDRGAIVSRLTNFFEEDDQVYRVPAVFLALVATAVYSALHDWRTGIYPPKADRKFSSEPYANIFDDHMCTLEQLEKNDEESYNSLRAKVYELAYGSNRKVKNNDRDARRTSMKICLDKLK